MATDTPPHQGGDSSPFNRTAQHDAKRTAILSQAAKLFNSKGSRATTLKDIAESLGLTKTSLYYYVKTKEELIYQCYMAALDRHHHNLDIIEQKHSGPMERASAYFLQHFESWLAAQEGREPYIAVLLEIAALKGPHREDVERRYIELFKRIREYIRQGIAEGAIREVDPTSTTLALLGSVDWTFSWLHTIEPDQVRATGKEALSMLANGIYGRDGAYVPADITGAQEEVTDLQGFNREERNRLKQEAFFKTGTWFFNKQGFNGTSLDEIAEQLNVSKGAFYYHIKNKEDLLFHCYNRSLDVMETIHTQAANTQSDGFDKAEFSCRRTFTVQNSDEGPLIRYNSITAMDMDRRIQILNRTKEVNDRFGAFLNEGIKDGSVRPINTYVAQQLVSGAINAAMDITMWRTLDDIDTAAIEYFDVFFNGLAPRKPASA
ncbi:MAG: AcrR family transcriptional regulator [Halioglobus sp.]|jgi:AcrR family transcriptional regulator